MDVEIRGFEDRRYAAVLASDAKALAPLLHKDLHYVHSSGTVQDREQYLGDLADGVWTYRDGRRSNETIAVLGKVALVSNQLDMNVVFRGDAHPVHSTALSVWVQEGGSWQLTAVQSTTIPSEKDAV